MLIEDGGLRWNWASRPCMSTLLYDAYHAHREWRMKWRVAARRAEELEWWWVRERIPCSPWEHWWANEDGRTFSSRRTDWLGYLDEMRREKRSSTIRSISLDETLTWIDLGCVDFLVPHNETESDGREEMDQEWQKRVENDRHLDEGIDGDAQWPKKRSDLEQTKESEEKDRVFNWHVHRNDTMDKDKDNHSIDDDHLANSDRLSDNENIHPAGQRRENLPVDCNSLREYGNTQRLIEEIFVAPWTEMALGWIKRSWRSATVDK